MVYVFSNGLRKAGVEGRENDQNGLWFFSGFEEKSVSEPLPWWLFKRYKNDIWAML